jgi:UTP--glucose-1-phosphate uridylyltransferase
VPSWGIIGSESNKEPRVRITKAVVTAAARNQHTLPLHTLFDRDGVQKSVLAIVVEEALRAGIEEIAVVVCPGDEEAFSESAGEHASRLRFIPQERPLGYGHAIYCARDFVGDTPFLHMVGDHVYVGGAKGCAQQLVEAAAVHSCSISGVQPTREHQLPFFGTIGGQRVPGVRDLYQIERVAEKPTPTVAEQSLMVPGLRAGHYLCFFGLHVLTPTVMELLARRIEEAAGGTVDFSPVLNELAQREKYLALEVEGRRYRVDVRYGLVTAQLALALSGQDREEVLTTLVELLAQRELDRSAG